MENEKKYIKQNHKGLKLIETKQYSKACTLYQHITSHFKHHFLAWFNLGMCAHFTGELDIAESAFSEALILKGEDPPSLNELGLVFFKKNEVEKAEKTIKLAIDLDPKNASYQNNLGVIFFCSERYSKAAKQFKLSVKLAPNYIDAWFNLRDCLEILGDEEGFAEASQQFEKLNNA